MGIFDRLKKTASTVITVSDASVIAPASGKMIDIKEVSDPVFSTEMMGKSAAFQYEGDEITICSPANGTLGVLFPTGHAFGVVMNNGMEILVHIGINTVDANGQGFKVLKKQGQNIKAGDPVVKVNLKQLTGKYDMSTMLIITNANNKTVKFRQPGPVNLGDPVFA